MKSNWKGPSLWECAKDIHSLKDFREFLPLLVPMPLYRLGRTVRHPIWWFLGWQRTRWAKSVKVGDKVIDCSHKLVTVVEKVDKFDFIDEYGYYHDVLACCEPDDGTGT